ncbi:MAG TPA: TetR/AcrR family transcriptional regulator [Phototrophicaceae bacterium]|jgi:AcrR family transcriptional regulator|nr:TetR/AcrR family transcriptional regulator [Phototrophicaceae bacterium]
MTDLTPDTTLSKRQQKTRLAFMDALLTLVVEKGFDQITVTDIANEANYGRWTFYQYFDSKEEAAWATFVYWMTQLDTYLVAAVQHLDSPYREYESWRLIFQAFHQQKSFLMRLDSVFASRWYVRAKDFLVQQFLNHLREGHFKLMDGVRPEIAARLYVVALMELLEYWGRTPELGDLDTLVDEFYIFIFNQPPPPPRQSR